MRTFETIRDVVDNAIDVHRQAAATFRRLDQRVSDVRSRMLLEYMRDHHANMEVSVGQVKRSVGDAVLGTYIQYSLDEDPRHLMENLLNDMDSLGIEEIEILAERVDNYQVELFEEALREMDSPKVTAFLRDILELEQLERRKLTMSMNSLADM